VNTISHINEKISSLNLRVDVQLNDESNSILTETLRGSLRSCISMIGETLNELESMAENESAIVDWFGQKKKLQKKRKQLENLLAASGRLDVEKAREEIGSDDDSRNKSGSMSGKKRERDSKNSASSLFSGSGKRSIGSNDKSWARANDLLSKLDEESESDSSDSSSDSSSSTDDLERALSGRKDKDDKDDLSATLGGGDSTDDSTSDSSSDDDLDELSALLESSSKTIAKPLAAPKGRTSKPTTSQSAFDLFRFGSGEKKPVITGADKPQIDDPSGLTVGYGYCEDTNVEGYRRKKKKGKILCI